MANTGSASSSITSTSHTMTAFPLSSTKSSFPTNPLFSKSTSVRDLIQALSPTRKHEYIQPTKELNASGLELAKHRLEYFATKLGEEHAEKLKDLRRKRKRGETDIEEGELLKIRRVHTEGFEISQVWEQARRVVDALREDAARTFEEMDVEDHSSEDSGEEYGAVDSEVDEDGAQTESEEESEDQRQGARGKLEHLELSPDGSLEEDNGGSVNEGEDDYEEDEDEDYEEEDGGTTGVFVEDPNGLNDGFFSIDEFNKQTEFLEQQDAAADPYTGEASDEEDIDWDADLVNLYAQPAVNSRRAAAMDVESDVDEGSDDDEAGPTFGNVDLNAPEGDSDDGQDDNVDEDINNTGDNTNDVLYRDFFEPPPRKAGKGERQASYLARQTRKASRTELEDDEAGVERAVADVRRDLFDDLSDQEDSEDLLEELDPADPKARRSAHERKQAKLAEEIRRLEAASVAKREWTLAGEARAADRPKNSLLEEQLDFEHTGKPVPEITAEISESIEELIKRRILAQEFDEVTRRRPDALVPANTRRGAFELDDTKPKQSLAEMYEEEHVKANNPDTYVSKADEKVRKEEKEIEALWKDVSAKLDALSSWHYKPKPVVPSLTVVADVATISMEDAQPTTAAGVSGGESMLAPQEIYKAGKEKEGIEKGEVVPKSGAPVARQEMTREEKLRRRRREKERIKKRGGVEINQRTQSKQTQQKRATIDELKKGGVKVIDRKGNVRDVDGNKVQVATALNGAGGFKL